MSIFNRDYQKADTPGAPVTAKLIKERYERSVKAMRLERQNYITNKAFLQGNQWAYWDETRDILQPHPREDTRVRVTVNRLRPASRSLMAKLLSRDLVFEVRPSDTDAASVRGAKTSEAVLRDIHREHKWEELRESLAWGSWLGGTSVLALDWDPSAGTPISQLPLTGATVGTGEIVETSHNVLEVAWEPGVRDAERGFWWIRAQALPPDEVMLRYGLKTRPAADASAATGFLSRSLTRRDGEAPVDLTLVLTMYERPSKLRPNGAVATVVGEEVVDGGVKNWPFPWRDRLNIVVFRESKADGRATGDTVFSDAVLVQTAYNAAWSSLLEHAKLAGNARLLWPEGSEEIDDLSDLPGEVVSFSNSLGKPEWLTPPNLPAWVIESPARLAAEMDDILSYHDVSRGIAPGALESGVGLSILVEQDSTPIGALTKEITHGFERFATLVLRLYQAQVKEPRTARIKGTVPEVVRWTGAALAGQTVADIPIDAVMPRSKAAQLSFAERMLTLSGGKMSFDTFAKIAEMPDQDSILAGIDPAAHKAERENHDFATGTVSVPATFDIHDTHIARHNNFRMSTRYETMSPEEREMVDLHIQAHETLAAEQMGEQVAKAQMSPALAAVPTANLHPSLPAGMAPVAPEGTSMDGMVATPDDAPPVAEMNPAGNPPPGAMSGPAPQ